MIDEEDRAEIGRKVRLAIWGALGAIAIVAAIASAATPEVEIGPYEPKPVEIAKPPPPPPAPPKVEEPAPEPIAPVHHAGHHRSKKHHDAAPGTAEAVGDINLKDVTKPGAIKPAPRSIPEDGGGGRCCKVCHRGKPCGDSCISAGKACNKPPGCAC